MKFLENVNFCCTKKKIEAAEEDFLKRMAYLMMNYPIVWYEFLENILKNGIILVGEANNLIVTISILNDGLKEIFDAVYQQIENANVIRKVQKRKNYWCIYIDYPNVLEFFKKTDAWLEYLTAEAMHDAIGEVAHRGVTFSTNDNINYDIDVITDINNIIYLAECDSSENNNSKNYVLELSKLSKRLTNTAFVIYITTKGDDDIKIDCEKYGVRVIKYNYNYYELVNAIQSAIIDDFLSLTN